MDARDVRPAYDQVHNLGEQVVIAVQDVTATEHAILECPTDDVELMKQHRHAISKATYLATVHQVAIEDLDAMIKVLTFEKLNR